METDTHHYGKGHWAGPAAALVLIAVGLVVLGWLEAGLLDTLLHG